MRGMPELKSTKKNRTNEKLPSYRLFPRISYAVLRVVSQTPEPPALDLTRKLNSTGGKVSVQKCTPLRN
jgi:hypothetical protein